MQIDNIIKEIRRIQDLYHMGNTLEPHEMEKWLIDLSYELLDYDQEVEDEMMYLRDEARDYEALYADRDQVLDEYIDMIDWLKGLSVYQLSEWKQGHISYD